MSHASSDQFANSPNLPLSIPPDSTVELVTSAIINHLDLPMICLNRSGQITYVNGSACAWFGRDDAELVGAEISSIWPGGPTADFADALQRLISGEVVATCDLEASARERQLRVRVQPIDTGLLLLVMERSPEEEALRLQAGLLDQAFSALFAWDLEGRIILWNRGAERLYGFHRDEAIGRLTHEVLTSEYPEGLDAVHEAQRRQGIWQGQLHRTRKDGTRILIESRHQLVVDGERTIVLEANRDISELRSALDQARRSEERLRMALAGSSILVYQQDRQLRYTWLYNVLGRWDEDAIGKTDADLLPLDEAETVEAIKRRVLETGAIERAEIETTLNQRTFHYALTVEPLRGDTGEIVGVTGSAIDLTRQREREERIAKLQELTAALASALDADSVARVIIDHGIAVVGANLGLVCVLTDNGEALVTRAMSGFRADESYKWLRIPTDRHGAIPDAARQRMPVYLETAEIRRQRYPISAQIHDAGQDGAATALPLVVDDRLIGVLGFSWAEDGEFDSETRDFLGALADLCAQALDRARLYDAERQARDAAQIAETRYRGLFERSADAVLIVHEDGRFHDANPAAFDLLGYDATELSGLTLAEISQLPDTDDAGDIPLEPSGETWLREFDLRRKDGTYVPIEARGTTIQTPTGPAMMIAARDISDRRMFQRMQQEFFASLSHDLKNPLSALRGQVQLLQRRLRRKGVLEATDVESGLETIESVGDRMTGMIEELVDVAQLRGGNPLRLKQQPTDLVAIAFRRVREHQQATTRHTVHLDLGESSLSGWWDESRLGRVVDNLLTNAIKYSHGGEIVVRLYREARADGDWAMMTITDSGLGIPEADLPRIFERFRRGSNVLDRFAGTGLGLAGVRQIVLQHGGDVSISSKEGVGTTVTVALPMTEPREADENR